MNSAMAEMLNLLLFVTWDSVVCSVSIKCLLSSRTLIWLLHTAF